MTYLVFHLLFVLPPIVVLLLVRPRPLARVGRWAGAALPILTLIALGYTTPWDNYLVREGVWTYGVNRVIGTIGYVPIEEYAFFLLQPVLTGLWLYHLAPDIDWSVSARGPLGPRLAGAAAALLVGAAAVTGAWRWESLTYLGLILGWAIPVVALQWAWGGGIFHGMRRLVLLAVAVPTLYLWEIDRVAIEQGIWAIADRSATGIVLAGLPIEEAVFFLMTNVMVVQGVLAFLWVGQHWPARSGPLTRSGRTSGCDVDENRSGD